MDERERRIIANEAVFREANEALISLEQPASVTSPLDVICECGRSDCIAKIEMTRQEYEQLRSDPTLFAVVAGHEIPDVEGIVEERAGYYVVKKPPETQEIAKELDTRSD